MFVSDNGLTISSLALADFPVSGSIGSAATTVDLYGVLTIPQTTASVVLTLPAPTVTTAGKYLRVVNTGSVQFTLDTAIITVDRFHDFVWTGAAWTRTPSVPNHAALTTGVHGITAAGATLTTAANLAAQKSTLGITAFLDTLGALASYSALRTQIAAVSTYLTVQTAVDSSPLTYPIAPNAVGTGSVNLKATITGDRTIVTPTANDGQTGNYIIVQGVGGHAITFVTPTDWIIRSGSPLLTTIASQAVGKWSVISWFRVEGKNLYTVTNQP